MKQLITLLIACATITAHAQNDSISTLVNFHVLGEKELVAQYPYITPLSSYEELSHEVMHLRFNKADAAARKLIATAKRKRQSTADLDQVVSICQKGESGLRGVDRVTIVDSLVVDKKDFLKAYPLSADLGTLTLSDQGDIVQYQTQLNGLVLRPEPISEDESTHLGIVRHYLEDGKLTEAEPIDGLGIDGDINYPFLMPDGQTFYFAARSDEGYGNYDLYATRYDSESKQFYQAENMGFPYNSYANDYMLVIDETAHLGWFASDRYQPHGKVCIYTFIPNESRQTIDYETTDLNELLAAASLSSIAALPLTDEQQQAKMDALRRIKQLTSTASATRYKDFEFILHDTRTCYTLDDFTSPEARKLCTEWLQKTKNLDALKVQLQQLRERVSSTNRQTILNLETHIMELQAEVHRLEKKIRNVELVK